MLVEKEDGFYLQEERLIVIEQQGHINYLIFKENYRSVTGYSPSIERAKKSMVKIIETDGLKIYAHKEHIDFMKEFYSDLIKRNTNKDES